MFPLLPFAVGLLTGAATLRLFKNKSAKQQLIKAQGRLRDATLSSLNVIEHSSARLRSRLAPEASEASSLPDAAAAEVSTPVVVKPERPTRAPRKRAPNSTEKASKVAPPKTGAEA